MYTTEHEYILHLTLLLRLPVTCLARQWFIVYGSAH